MANIYNLLTVANNAVLEEIKAFTEAGRATWLKGQELANWVAEEREKACIEKEREREFQERREAAERAEKENKREQREIWREEREKEREFKERREASEREEKVAETAHQLAMANAGIQLPTSWSSHSILSGRGTLIKPWNEGKPETWLSHVEKVLDNFKPEK
ncbi:U2 small nuclear ribonucleoprotein auxiliary factor 35 kDa subunit-related protein 2-like [Macrobrachium nipponense]|uniref:U2 small nuclear ribonucleoprotein auxiliary factor 35 kDa subunit-related protein 2-like n=1 Tax=Macrobrachium nipponense TaxID=159736 RepID=UPI0030C86784